LATIDLKHPGLRFGVAGARLLTAVLDLAQDYGDPTSEYGIEEPVPDRQTRMPEAGETSEYPYASRFVPAKHFWRPPSPRAIGRVVVHITDGGTSIEGPISWFKNPVKPDGSPLPVSAHYVIGQNGEVVQMVKQGDVAYHAGSANGDSIGIEHCARAPRANVSGIDPTPIQYAASAALVRWLCEGYGIPMDREHILGHAEADPHTTHTACPNAVWDWDYYMSLVLEGMSIPEDET
jgi:N-acetyl-anhydromuramyl-L-alanine amidase AmpD